MTADLQEIADLVSLFDDSDTVVTGKVNERLISLGTEVIPTLLTLASRESDKTARNAILERTSSINTELRLSALEDFASRPKGPLSLFEGSLIVCSMLNPKVTRESYEDDFFRCSAEYLSEASDQRTGVENIRIFNHIFYHRLRFTLCDVELRDPAYSLISDVLKSRKGNPFALSLIYFMIAQESGLPLQALCFPGGFVPVYVENGKELFYINVYHGGEIFLKDHLDEFISRTGINIDKNTFRRRDESAMLSIYLESLLYIYSNRHYEKKCSAIDRALNILGSERFLAIDEEDL